MGDGETFLMSLNDSVAVKEHKNILVGDFQDLQGEGSIVCLEEAWDYYSSLNAVERAAVRSYISSNGEADFGRFLMSVRDATGNGTADYVGKWMLIQAVNEELLSLPEAERRNYLNGQPLKFKL